MPTFRPALTVPRAALRDFAPLPRPQTLVKRWEAFAAEGMTVQTTLIGLKVACEGEDVAAADTFVGVLNDLGIAPFLHVFGLVATQAGWTPLPFFHRTLARCHVPVADRLLLEASARIVTFATVPALAVVGGTGGPVAVTRAVDDLLYAVGLCPTLAPFLYDAFVALGRRAPADAVAKCYALVKRFGPPDAPTVSAGEA